MFLFTIIISTQRPRQDIDLSGNYLGSPFKHPYLYSKQEKKEDFRYQKWRDDWGRNFYWRSFLQVFLLQSLLIIVVMAPVLIVSYSPDSSWSWPVTAGIFVWFVGFIYETVADLQLFIFSIRKRKGQEIMKTGLWKYSRHPNYFGEIVVWWGIYICVLPLNCSLLLAISPLTMTYLLLFVSGVPMLERRYENHLEYQAYKKNTPAILPKWSQ
ncbi:MAG: DUF1295 domain-containing protein [Saprospiraceae bacterium]|nr:DUF1295 domain-containing protein [Saprospiraceae bacterium]